MRPRIFAYRFSFCKFDSTKKMKSNHLCKYLQINIIVSPLKRCYKKNNKYSYNLQCVYKNSHKNYIYTEKMFKNIKKKIVSYNCIYYTS